MCEMVTSEKSRTVRDTGRRNEKKMPLQLVLLLHQLQFLSSPCAPILNNCTQQERGRHQAEKLEMKQNMAALILRILAL